MKKIISILLCAILCVGTCATLVACDKPDGEQNNGGKVKINYAIGDGGFGRAHADDLAEQFMIWAADKEYGGVKGADVEVFVESQTNIASAKGQNYHVMNTSCEGPNLEKNVQLGFIANVDDVVKEKQEMINGELVSIESKIPDYARGSFQGAPEADGERDYYAVPGYSYAPGFTYDENSFNKNGYFFADSADEPGAVPFDSVLMGKTYYFLEGTGKVYDEPSGKKSAGPDQKYNSTEEPSQDDGLPSSLIELAVLCEKIKKDSRNPFIVWNSGKYMQMFSQALFIQLMGYDQLYTWMNFDGGPIEVVTGYTNEPLFPGFDALYDEKNPNPEKYIYKPTTAIVNLTEENGYYSSCTYAEYLATAFTQLAEDLGWIYTTSSTEDQKQAMREFVYSGFEPEYEECLMFVEMNFWYNEAKTVQIHEKFEYLYNDDGHLGERRMTWMSLPTVFDEYTDEQLANGKTRQVLYGTNNNGLAIASYVQDDPALFEACKDLLQFYCTDYQMNRWTKEIGIRKTANYTITQEVLNDMPWYCRKLGELMNQNIDVMITYAENKTFKDNYLDYVCGYHSSPLQAEIGGTNYEYILTYFTKVKGATAKEFFNAGVLTKEMWEGKYRGSSTVAPYTVIDGVEIKFNPALPN